MRTVTFHHRLNVKILAEFPYNGAIKPFGKVIAKYFFFLLTALAASWASYVRFCHFICSSRTKAETKGRGGIEEALITAEKLNESFCGNFWPFVCVSPISIQQFHHRVLAVKTQLKLQQSGLSGKKVESKLKQKKRLNSQHKVGWFDFFYGSSFESETIGFWI